MTMQPDIRAILQIRDTPQRVPWKIGLNLLRSRCHRENTEPVNDPEPSDETFPAAWCEYRGGRPWRRAQRL